MLFQSIPSEIDAKNRGSGFCDALPCVYPRCRGSSGVPGPASAGTAKIDGALEDAVWQNSPLTLGDWISYNPVRGEKSSFRTDVRIAYDERYLYFAFHCFDPEPSKIRATISRRDNVFNDDWIGLSLDSAATGQTSYHLMVNPSGIRKLKVTVTVVMT